MNDNIAKSTNVKLIFSGPANGEENMSIDESIFESTLLNDSFGAVLRFYTWDCQCFTIGYFQPYFQLPNSKIIRRITGGLTVEHKTDISYCFCANKNTWPYVYDQEENYKKLHLAIKTGLDLSGYKTEFANPSSKTMQANMCVEKFFAYDLLLNGKKVVGSCQRRRGDCLIVQGSLHLPKNYNAENVMNNLSEGFKKELGFAFVNTELSTVEVERAEKIKESRYQLESWNRKY